MSEPRRWNLIFALLLLIAFLRAVLYGFVLIPPWQAPDEPGHYEYMQEVALYGLRRPNQMERERIQSEIIASLYQERFWRLLHPERAELRPRLFLALAQYSERPWGMRAEVSGPRPHRFLRYPYLHSQREDEPLLYYLFPAVLFRYVPTIIGRLYVARGWSSILYVVTVAFVFLGLRVGTSACSSPTRWFVPIVGGTWVSLAPMPAFIGSSCNNDVAAMAASAVVFWMLLRGVHCGWTAGKAVGLIAMLGVAAFTKKTAMFLWPLSIGVLIALHWAGVRAWIRQRWQISLVMALGILAAAGVAWTWHLDAASGWIETEKRQVAPRTKDVVRTGSYAFLVNSPAGSEPTYLLQELSYNTVLRYRGQNLKLVAWVTGENAINHGHIEIHDGQASTRLPFEVSGDGWTRLLIWHRVAEDADRLTIVLANAGSRRLFFDDLSLEAGQSGELLANPGAEEAARWPETWLARRQSISPGLLPRFLEADSYNVDSLTRYALYTAAAFASFWANFGWLTLPLTPVWYVVVFLGCAIAGVGILRAMARAGHKAPPARLTAGLIAAALILIGMQTFLPMIGSAWQPQGRYLFPALLPIAAFLARGWQEWAPAKALPLLAVYLIGWMFVFEQVCIWGYVIPRYA